MASDVKPGWYVAITADGAVGVKLVREGTRSHWVITIAGTYGADELPPSWTLGPAIADLLCDAERRTTLFDAIAHGDDEHRAWLKKAIGDHFAGRLVERPRGKGERQP